MFVQLFPTVGILVHILVLMTWSSKVIYENYVRGRSTGILNDSDSGEECGAQRPMIVSRVMTRHGVILHVSRGTDRDPILSQTKQPNHMLSFTNDSQTTKSFETGVCRVVTTFLEPLGRATATS